MFHAIKTVRASPSSSFPRSSLARQTSLLRFRQTQSVSVSGQPDSGCKMDKPPHNPDEKHGDVMSHSFGEGYATRSDEEGFGGIYGGNESDSKIETDEFIHENHPAYDKTQGSEVKEKEKARHQTNASS
ncbi:uncharacterized protein LOC114744426 [Neltuma alba]|uniref:uncharacterized protein LOC114744426 n=1 Tax=Neltuma alba TaxID=207710 RepID=UPI0010A4F36E|nr:uncharacterized protein LOC114744426 [Prosopis alba]